MKILIFGYGYYVLGDDLCEGGTILRSLVSWIYERKNFSLDIHIAVRSEVACTRALERISIFRKKHNFILNKLDVSIKVIDINSLDKDYDGCIVAIPETYHFETLRKVVDISKNVACVKPLCLDYAEFTSILELYAGRKIPLVIDLHKRFDESNIAFINSVSANLSRHNLFKFSYGQKSVMPMKYFHSWSSSSNPFQYLAPHYLDIIFKVINCSKPEEIKSLDITTSSFNFDESDLLSLVVASIRFEYQGNYFSILADCNWQEPDGMPFNSRQRIEYIGKNLHYNSEQDNRGQLVGTNIETKIPNPHFMTDSDSLLIDGYGKRLYSNFMDYIAGLYPLSLLPLAYQYSSTAFIIDRVNKKLHATN